MKNATWKRVLLLVIPYFFTVALFGFLGMLMAGIDLESIDALKTTKQNFIITFFGAVGTFVILWVFMKYVDKEPIVKMGFHTQNRGKDFLIGVILGAVIMAFGYAFLITLDEIIYLKINFDIKEIMYAIAIYAFIAFTEEILFRGYVLKNFLSSMNPYVALVMSSLLFSLLHSFNPNMNWFSFLSLFTAGIFLGTSYIYTKNLWFPIAIHFSWNLFQSLFGFNVSGQDLYSILEFKIPENNMLNGGDFGFEGSYISVIIEIILIFMIILYYKRSDLNAFYNDHKHN